MTIKNTMKEIGNEFLNTGIGWIIGLMVANFVNYFFTQKSWRNLCGLATKKTAVSADMLMIIEFLAEAIVGFLVLVLINKIIVVKIRQHYAQHNENASKTGSPCITVLV